MAFAVRSAGAAADAPTDDEDWPRALALPAAAA